MADIRELLKQLEANKEKVKTHFEKKVDKKCSAKTKSGKPCKNEAFEDGYCSIHQKGE